MINRGLINVGSHGAQAGSQLALSDGLACFTGSFSGVTSTSISHGLNSTDLVVEFKDSLGNLLIPDTWSITNLNVIEAEFSPAATGNVTIIACIESGLAPIRAGVLILEGLSGIIDLDSPNESIDISTSGQVINLNAIFTPASGAILQQKCADLITLSGLIGTGGGGDAGQTSINGLSGVVLLTSPDNSILIGDNGQAIELSGLFTSASGLLLEQLVSQSGFNCTTLTFNPSDGTDFTLTHGLATEDFTWAIWRTNSTPIRAVLPFNVSPVGLNDVRIRLFVPITGKIVITACPSVGVAVGPPGASGAPGVDGVDGLFTATSGALLEQKCEDINTLSGIILYTPASGAIVDNAFALASAALPGTSGSILRLNQGVAHYNLSADAGSFTTVLTTVPLDSTIVEDSTFYSRSGGVITINVAGLYRIAYSINIDETAGNSRSMVTSQAALNGSTQISQSIGYVYSRLATQGEGTITKEFWINLSATDTIEAEAVRFSGASTFTFLEGSTLSLEFVRFP